MQKKLHQLIEDYKILSEKMTDLNIINNVAEYTRLAKEHRKLAPVINKSEEYLKLLKESDDNKELLLSEDIELKELAKEDLLFIQGKIKNLEDELKILLLPKDPNDDKNTILEIRSGTGGNEAALFAEDLYRMYLRYAELQKWKYEVISLNDNEGGGIKEVIVSILGQNVFGNLKYESGVHRVQRIPETESSGRIHTSAATVAVLPEAEEVDIQINDNDIKIDTYRASGAGGQHVNKTESAIRITHLPTNLVVTCQDESSQHKNRDKAMKVLRSRLLEHKTEKANKERSTARKKMVSTGDRSAKIRTYNFPQGRVTDHRINLTLYKLEEIMNGDIDEVINSLKNEDQKLQLELINK